MQVIKNFNGNNLNRDRLLEVLYKILTASSSSQNNNSRPGAGTAGAVLKNRPKAD
ncbi:hypothetical protein JOC37_001570 [Desulfohalotomaculum tongense]|uniref:hypothetical protein n=1 Tax=Desulforadius tongensis TaxID=1216062 RepID=UPI001958C12F|nr:hypothetical protein [Desulforadius tongensis]MBM7855185.1 hypothetical protein [Desulforadius tongensis]